MAKTRKVQTGQFSLLQPEERDQTWWQCRGIFSPNYLKQHLTQSEHIPAASECMPLYQKIKDRWLEKLPALRTRNEDYTRDKFLNATLGDLGWHYIPNQDMPKCPTRKVPDYCLFLTEDEERRVAAGDATDLFRASASMVEAKKAQHSLDVVSKKETPGLFPSQQVQDYLWHAKDNTGRFFNWAILTNGNEWRLYSANAKADACFAFHLAHDESFCPIEDFRLFVALFSPGAFAQEDARCKLDDWLNEALVNQEELETNLRKRVFNVLVDLASGFYHKEANGLKEPDLPDVYETSLIFLYRLLFILYAESRGLLPAKLHGPGSNARYYSDFSLARLVTRLRDRNAYDDDAFPQLYEELLNLFHLINGTDKAQNEALGVTRYNGGLFDHTRYAAIERWRVGEKTLADVLRQLVFAQPPARSAQQVIATEETVDFGSLEVRQLGDIYEGLLGGRLVPADKGRLQLVNEKGQNHQEGIFYTPDWVVQYLVRESLQPIVDRIGSSAPVQTALSAKSTEKVRDNSFAMAVLALKLVDPAMGSGHFLVRATEWLAEQIVYHPTTRLQTEQVVANGSARRSREDILAAGRTPVPPGVPQEQAEVSYWRRRVVESCIHGVDTNSLAVELAKLSLWLTCIAVDEPLSFLDHHLREGNSLLHVTPEEALQAPGKKAEEDEQVTVNIGHALTQTIRDAIRAEMSIEAEASTEIEVVKAKAERWKKVCATIEPYLQVLHLWLALADGAIADAAQLTAYDYRLMALHAIQPDQLDRDSSKAAKALWARLSEQVNAKTADLSAFHWHLEFPAVFYGPDGHPKRPDERGFDVVLGNPPYISTHTSSEEKWRNALERRAGYLDDLYVHFTDLGFSLLKRGGMFGFIVSDTFFTLATKMRMRQWLQEHRLTHIGQCDPFNATVDAAVFVACNDQPEARDRVLFVQARYSTDGSKAERELPLLPKLADIECTLGTPDLEVEHGSQGCLRFHLAPVGVYRRAVKRAFFEPRPAVLELYRRFNDPVQELVEAWWDRIETSRKYSENIEAIREYQADLQPGDITLVGLIAEGGQGMRTADNARFLGYLAGSRRATEVERKRESWTHQWLEDPRIAATFRDLLARNGADARHPTADSAAWEAAVAAMRADRQLRDILGFGTTDLYRIASPELVATRDDWIFAWKRRKAELLARWQTEPSLQGYWDQSALIPGGLSDRPSVRIASDVTDETFCALCRDLQNWVAAENKRRGASRPKQKPIPREALGLRSSENYSEPSDAPRIAVIYSGLTGRANWLPFRKGDPEGNRWTDNEPLYVDWSASCVEWLSSSPSARWQGHSFFLTPGISYTFLGNHVALKAKMQEPCIFDAGASRLTSVVSQLPHMGLLALFNSDVFSFFVKKLVKNTQDFEISDLRATPVVIPTTAQAEYLSDLAHKAVEAKLLTFTGGAPSNELAAFSRELGGDLSSRAPAYLRPSAQQRLMVTAHDCLSIIELAVNWEAEKLYGVEGLGPFDEF